MVSALFNPARWQFWRRGLQGLASNGDGTGRMARQALDLMPGAATA